MPERILAVDPGVRSFGYVVLEGADFLVAWGLVITRGDKSKETLRRVSFLIETYRPDVFVLEHPEGRGGTRGARQKDLLFDLAELGKERFLRVKQVAPADVLDTFRPLGIRRKDAIAEHLASRFPELAPHCPPRRKAWKSEDERMGIFDALGFVVASAGGGLCPCVSEGPRNVIASARDPRNARDL